MDVEINAAISFIDVFIVIVLIWAIYKGFKRGPIVHALSLLVVVLGIAIFGTVSVSIADKINQSLTSSIDTLHYFIFAILFIAAVWLSNFISDKTEINLGTKPKGIVNIILGILTSTLKYLYLLSIFLLYFSLIDNSYNIVGSVEKRRSKLYKTVKNIAPATIKTISFLND
ncbi:MAG: CvpA family protein [Chlorobi bacterium]|nr:CvpA family protein [Chlorobiota bacterium]